MAYHRCLAGRSSEQILRSLIPVMTSNTTPCGTVFASTATNPAWIAFDGNLSTTWNSKVGSAIGSYIGYDFERSVAIRKIIMTNSSLTAITSNIIGYSLQYSSNNTQWFSAGSITNRASGSGVTTEDDFLDFGKYRYWRVLVNSFAGSSGNSVAIAELEMIGYE